MRPREAFPRAPTGFEFNYDELARYPQAMTSTPAYSVIFGDVVGDNSTAAPKVSDKFPLWAKYCGGIPPKLY